MKSRFLMSVVVMIFACCIVCGAGNIPDEEIPEADMHYEEIKAGKFRLSEEEKKQVFDEYLKNVFVKDIMTNKGVLGCKLDVNLDGEKGAEKSVTVMYFYDPEELDDVASFEDSVQQYMFGNYPEAEVIYTRGTPVYHEGEEFVEPFEPIQTLPADLNSNWNYVPIVPN